MTARVAVVIPTHNHVNWLDEAVASAVYQSRQPDLVVVVDDGSTDGTWEHIQEKYRGDGARQFVREFASVPLLFRHSEWADGPAAARNLGVRLANDYPGLGAGLGGYFFLDSDDCYYPGKIEESLRAWDIDRQTIGCVYSDYSTFWTDGGVTRYASNYKPIFNQAHLQRECIINCDSFVSRAAFEWAGGFPEELRVCEDYCLWLKLTRRYLAYHIAAPLVRIRVGRHSATSLVAQETWQRCHRRAFEIAGAHTGAHA